MKTSSKKSFNAASCESHQNNPREKYVLLQRIPIEFITPINFGAKIDDRDFDPLTDHISSPFRYNNTSQLLTGKVRRNEIYHSSAMLAQKSIIDLGAMIMVSKMHILGLPGTTMFNVYASQRPHDSYQRVTLSQTAKHNQNLRVVSLGNIPARYLMIEVIRGEPLPNDEDAVEVYGMNCGALDSELGQDGGSQLLMDKAFQIIYGFNSKPATTGR